MKAIYTGSYLLNQKRKREPGTVSETREAVPAKSPLWAGVSGRTQGSPLIFTISVCTGILFRLESVFH